MAGFSIKPYTQRPSGPGISPDHAAWMDWATSALNALIGQTTAPTQIGLPAVANNQINPTNSQFISQGGRPGSIATPIAYLSNFLTLPFGMQFYWDGTNGSQALTIHRDDGTSIPNIIGNFTVLGLTASTKYYFYPYYQESVEPGANFGAQQPGVQWASVEGAVGNPPVAYTAPNAQAAAIQISRDHIPLAVALSVSGVTMAASGSAVPGSAGGGGGGVGVYLGSSF